MSYDLRCYDLAEIFLQDEPKLAKDKKTALRLAQCIQTVIEDWIAEERETGAAA